MKVVFLSGVETAGGGNVAASRLANGLTEQGVSVTRLYNQRVTSPFGEPRQWNSRFVGLPRGLDILNNGLRRFSAPAAARLGGLYANVALANTLSQIEFDILHVHVIHNSFWNLSSVERLPIDIPTVWTFHDCWGFSPEAQLFRNLDGQEVRLRPDGADRAAALGARQKYFRSRRFCRLASNSTQVAQMATAALGMPVEPLGYGLDLDKFRPLEKCACRRALGIGDDAFIMLLVADNLADPVKGFAVLEKALRESEGLRGAILLTVGGEECGEFNIGAVRVQQLGRLYNPALMALVYSAADVLVMPSLAEALGQVAMESVACGVPVVGSNVQGIPDVARPGQTGFLFSVGDPEALRRLLERLRANPAEAAALAQSCRAFAVENWDFRHNAKRYLALYEDLLRDKERGREIGASSGAE